MVTPYSAAMCLPAYRAGTERVARLRRQFPDSAVIPTLYGCSGLVDVVTIQSILQTAHRTDTSH